MTLINVIAAIDAGEAATALALEAVMQVEATATVGAGLCEAEVYATLAHGTRIAGRAFALIFVIAVDACAAILAWIAMTIVDVFLAIGAVETVGAVTLILIAAYRRALAVVETGIRIAVLHLKLAVPAAIASGALALETLTRVATSAAVQTRFARTRHGLCLAMLPNPPVAALACVAIREGTVVVGTCAVVQARIDVAVSHLNLAVSTEIPGRTLACVRSLAGVGAGSAVVTRLVIGAEVEILVAEKSAPALLADALPLIVAGSMHTSWIHFTLVTIRSPVSALASVSRQKCEDN